MENFFDILGLSKKIVRELDRDTVLDLADKNYKALAKKYHPDIGFKNKSKFQEINNAYNSLKDSFVFREQKENYLRNVRKQNKFIDLEDKLKEKDQNYLKISENFHSFITSNINPVGTIFDKEVRCVVLNNFKYSKDVSIARKEFKVEIGDTFSEELKEINNLKSLENKLVCERTGFSSNLRVKKRHYNSESRRFKESRDEIKRLSKKIKKFKAYEGVLFSKNPEPTLINEAVLDLNKILINHNISSLEEMIKRAKNEGKKIGYNLSHKEFQDRKKSLLSRDYVTHEFSNLREEAENYLKKKIIGSKSMYDHFIRMNEMANKNKKEYGKEIKSLSQKIKNLSGKIEIISSKKISLLKDHNIKKKNFLNNKKEEFSSEESTSKNTNTERLVLSSGDLYKVSEDNKKVPADERAVGLISSELFFKLLNQVHTNMSSLKKHMSLDYKTNPEDIFDNKYVIIPENLFKEKVMKHLDFVPKKGDYMIVSNKNNPKVFYVKGRIEEL
ncbi:MAG: J domain-containing protein [Nanoarchaeota archaeon]